jgi:hypothetical protein
LLLLEITYLYGICVINGIEAAAAAVVVVVVVIVVSGIFYGFLLLALLARIACSICIFSD